MLQALGLRLLDKNGQSIGFGGAALSNLTEIQLADLDPRLQHVQIEVACDVNNPLCGEQGASAIFGPQKGATPEMVKEPDAAAISIIAVLPSPDKPKKLFTWLPNGAVTSASIKRP